MASSPPFSLQAEGFTSVQEIDLAEVKAAMAVIADDVAGVELRGLPSGRSLVRPGDDLEGIAAAAQALADDNGIYYCINPVRPSRGDVASKDAEVLTRRWLLIDLDPVKEDPDASATEAEKERCRKLACAISAWLTANGWPAPMVIDSGNGWHLLSRTEMSNDDDAKDAVKMFLRALSARFTGPDGLVDLRVYNAARIAKLPGTWSRKGPATAQRPHRMARIVELPGEGRPVLVGQVRQATIKLKAECAQPAAPPANGKNHAPAPAPFELRATNEKDVRERAAAYLQACPPAISGQNGHAATLSAARAVVYGFDLGADAGLELLTAHYNPRCQPPWSERELRHKCDEAAGVPYDKPRGHLLDKAPVLNGRNGSSHGGANGRLQLLDPSVSIIQRASDIKPRKVEWLWPGRIPMGKLTTFAGMGGLGKTFALCDITARVTTGAPWPDSKDASAEVGQVLFVSGEDDLEDTIVPRLIELGADLTRVVFLTTDVQDRFTLADLEVLEVAIQQIGPGLRFIAIDPPTAFLGPVDDHKNAQLRGLLSPLKSWAARQKIAIVFNTHVNKGTGAKVEAMARVIGSVAWVNAVRAAHMFSKSPDDPSKRYFIPMKMNISRERKGLAYRIEPTNDDLAVIRWLGEVDTTADEAVNCSSRTRKAVARTWLVDRFKEQLEWSSEDLFNRGKQDGLSRNAIFGAKELLDLPKARLDRAQDGGRTWVWWVPIDWKHFDATASPQPAEDEAAV